MPTIFILDSDWTFFFFSIFPFFFPGFWAVRASINVIRRSATERRGLPAVAAAGVLRFAVGCHPANSSRSMEGAAGSSRAELDGAGGACHSLDSITGQSMFHTALQHTLSVCVCEAGGFLLVPTEFRWQDVCGWLCWTEQNIMNCIIPLQRCIAVYYTCGRS